MSATSGSIILPADVQRALEHAGALAAQFAGQEPSHQLDSLKTAIYQRFEDAFAAPLRARNARTVCFSLPDEVWITTWSLLDLPDRLNVSYVCHAWRILALSAPSLWTSITLTCELRYEADQTVQCYCNDSDESQKFTTNLRWANYILPRSRNAPLSISIHTGEFAYYPSYADDVCAFISPHGPRVEALFVRCAYASFFNQLLPMLSPLPALRKLGARGTSIHPPGIDAVFDGQISLPSLETLTISSTFCWSPTANIQFQSLRTLSLSVSNALELGAALRACPALQYLCLSSWIHDDSPNWVSSLASSLRRIPKVTIYLSNRSDEHTIVALFEHAPGTDVVLVYRSFHPTQTGLRMVQSLVRPVHIAFTSEEERRVVMFSDPSRTVSFAWPAADGHPPVLPERDIPSFPAASVADLECDLARWPGVLSAFPDRAGVAGLTLRFASAEDIDIATQSLDCAAPAFPSLSSVRIHGMSPGIELDAQRVQALVSKLSAGRRLCSLELARVRLHGAVHDLSEIAEDVRFG